MGKTTRDRAPPKTLVQLIQQLGYRHSAWQIFADFAEMAAISVTNAVDLAQRDAREARYMEIVRRYSADEVRAFPEMLAALVLDLEHEPEDVLGRVFHELELHNKWTGQYFTPFPLCRAMAKMIVGDGTDTQTRISERGFLTASEPACGSGAMIIALAQELRAQGVNFQQQLHVTAVDVDVKCVHMAYLQFALLHIPAVVVLGDSLQLEERARWYTPAHILGGWSMKLRRIETIPEAGADAAPEPDRPEGPGEQRPMSRKPSQLTLF